MASDGQWQLAHGFVFDLDAYTGGVWVYEAASFETRAECEQACQLLAALIGHTVTPLAPEWLASSTRFRASGGWRPAMLPNG